MKIDPYTPCPGGTGKKVKFCDSCKDHLGDLEKIYKLLDGEQRAACLEYCDKVDKATPDRACVLSVKTLLESQLGMRDRANATLAHFLAKFPENPVALAEKAIQNAADGLLPLAVDTLQDAMQNCDEHVPGRLLDAISVVGRAALTQGYIQAARGHLMLELGLSQGDETAAAMQLLMRINNSSDIPVVLKDDAYLKPPAEGAANKAEFEEALQLAARGSWRGAEKKFVALATRDDSPELWHNLAVLRSWLADQDGQLKALRKLAALDIPLDDAVEYEALAQTLDQRAADDEVDLIRAVIKVVDLDQLLESLAASSKALAAPAPPQIEGDEPPPRAMFALLDRDDVKSGADIAMADVPLMLGRLLIFGKQTDREARVELIAYRGEALDTATSTLREIAGEALSADESEEEVIGHNTKVTRLLTPAWRLPEDVTRERALSLMEEFQHNAIFDGWPNLSMSVLDGKTPAEAAQDEALRVKLLAAVLVLEQSMASDVSIDFNQLRAQLGLPTADPIATGDLDPEQVSLVRMPRLVVSDIKDDDLVTLYRRAAMAQHAAAIRLLGPELVSRPSLDDTVDKAEAYAIMARHSQSSDDAIDLLNKARSAAEAQNESPARWFLEELPLRLERGEPKEAEEIINILRDKHFNEPGVADALYQLLAQVQAMAGQGMGAPPAGDPAPATAGVSAAPPQAAAAAESKQVWTPESQQGGGGGGGKLWTPD
ncbi:MAG: hypothetical protein MI757_06415 [Pirellulales bacterium]|nr:hypothetical protein [Pirellulales bacterium]